MLDLFIVRSGRRQILPTSVSVCHLPVFVDELGAKFDEHATKTARIPCSKILSSIEVSVVIGLSIDVESFTYEIMES